MSERAKYTVLRDDWNSDELETVLTFEGTGLQINPDGTVLLADGPDRGVILAPRTYDQIHYEPVEAE